LVIAPSDQHEIDWLLHRTAFEHQYGGTAFNRAEGQTPFRLFGMAREIGYDLVAPFPLQPVHQFKRPCRKLFLSVQSSRKRLRFHALLTVLRPKMRASERRPPKTNRPYTVHTIRNIAVG
jgi:hypothetical protein